MATTGDNTTGNGGNSTITYNSVNIITALGGAIGNGQSSGRVTQSGGSGAGGVRNYSASGNGTQKQTQLFQIFQGHLDMVIMVA